MHRQAGQDGRKRFWLMASAGVLLFACSAPLLAPVEATLDPNSVNTVIAETAAAAQSRTAVFTPPTWTPSFTPFPSQTASITPTASETFVFALATFTHTRTPSLTPAPTNEGGGGGTGGGGSGGADYDCDVEGVSPPNNTTFAPDTDFDATWTVKNTGATRWQASGMDYVFVSGDGFHQQSGYDLPQNVKSGATINLGVDMRAPSTNGTYTTTWNLKAGKVYFCNMKLTIRVQ